MRADVARVTRIMHKWATRPGCYDQNIVLDFRDLGLYQLGTQLYHELASAKRFCGGCVFRLGVGPSESVGTLS